jgi:protein-S-isoprenylcysteine O-methyltransferase Ste14
MKTASVVLGTVGGILALICAILILLGSAFFNVILNQIYEEEKFYSESENEDSELDADDLKKYKLDDAKAEDDDESTVTDEQIKNFMSWFGIIYGLFVLTAGLLGVISVFFVNTKNVLAGVLMLVGGIIMFITLWGFIIAVMLVLGGIFALVNGKNSNINNNSARQIYNQQV